jgi:hypothetical protein
MTKSGTLITSALLAIGFAAGAMAADMPRTATTTPVAADATAPSTDTAKPAKKAKKSKKAKKAAAAPATTN